MAGCTEKLPRLYTFEDRDGETRICKHILVDDGVDEFIIPGNAVAYDGLEYGVVTFYREVEQKNHVRLLPNPGYHRRMRVISKQGVGGSERKVELP